MKRKEAIKKLQEGTVQVHNDLLPSTKEIKKLLKEAFPEDDYNSNGGFDFKYMSLYKEDIRWWTNSNNPFKDLKIVNLSSISKGKNKLKQLEKSFAELSKDVAELKSKDWGSIVTSENLDVEKDKPKLEIGKWYFGTDVKILFCFNGKYGSETNYGFNALNEWSEDLGAYETDDYILATPKEISKALIEEAKKRGYKVGVKVFSVTSKTERICEIELYYNSIESNQLLFGHACCVFQDGLWSEIIEQPKEEVIDFSKPQLLIYDEDNSFVVMTNGIESEDNFEAYVVSDKELGWGINYFSNMWSKECFKPFKGTLTINQE